MSVQTDAATVVSAAEARDRYGQSLFDLETARYALVELARDMHAALMRGAFSPVVRDMMDCSAALHMRTARGWETVAVREGCSLHAFSTQHICNFTMNEWDSSTLRDGDVIFQNDPWRGSVHQADINVLRPVRVDGDVLFVLHSTSHVIDFGGPAVGGFAFDAPDHFHEPMKFPPTLLYAEDIPVRSTFNRMLENVRLPGPLLGDLRALYGCLVIGERRLRAILASHGRDLIVAAGEYALDVAEHSMRAALRTVPDGDYRAEEILDAGGAERDAVPLCLCVKVRGDSAEIDFSGTGRQSSVNINIAWAEANRPIIGLKMLLDPHTLVNGGTLRPFQTLLPVGSVVCALPPAGVGNHVDVGIRATNLVTQAIGQALPARSIGDDTAASGVLIIGGVDSRDGHEGQPYGAFALPGGGWGGTAAADGLTFCLPPLGNCRTSVQEHVERECPVVVWQLEIMPDSAGVGQHRGGFGGVFTAEVLSDAYVSIGVERVSKGAPGTQGGGRAMPSYAWRLTDFDPATSLEVTNLAGAIPLFGMFNSEGYPDPEHGEYCLGTEFSSGKVPDLFVKAGDAVRLVVGGGGGWGDPLLRDPAAVLNDVRDGLNTVGFVRAAYGVVIRDSSVDEEATAALRATLAADRGSGRWSPPDAVPPAWSR
jgi:N-methylhydantoinase B